MYSSGSGTINNKKVHCILTLGKAFCLFLGCEVNKNKERINFHSHERINFRAKGRFVKEFDIFTHTSSVLCKPNSPEQLHAQSHHTLYHV